ncbi:uncharacterized protein BX664DRAFT_381478 [Halteromyces radiatus]|uniref:uncharacterized protein n=1 Tax=Halteromyces radiatus TaxID=101107 RepID=UPI00221F4B88|nr:uncharacterized protein BX664DRAFT_381478 [Halteromyces radiatus]KAI8098812.1 hypothetical protein BX664DRAFT_381478 [Halteromyces radiatus]
MIETIFDIEQPLPKNSIVTYDLQPSHQFVNIRTILASRKRNSSSSPTPSKDNKKIKKNKKNKNLVYDDMISGLPSPPVESPMADFPSMTSTSTDNTPPLTPNTTFTMDSSSPLDQNKSNLSTEDILAKLAALREEKHNLFQLMKRLVEEEEQQQRQKQQSIDLQKDIEQQQQQQQEQKKRKPSRWSSSNPSSLEQQSTFISLPQQQQQQQQQRFRNNMENNTPRPFSSRSFNPPARSHSYFGQRSSIHRSHQPPYLY